MMSRRSRRHPSTATAVRRPTGHPTARIMGMVTTAGSITAVEVLAVAGAGLSAAMSARRSFCSWPISPCTGISSCRP